MVAKQQQKAAAMTTALENLAVWRAEIDRAGELTSLQIQALAAQFAKEGEDAAAQDVAAIRRWASELTDSTADTPLAAAQQLSKRIALCRALPRNTVDLLLEATKPHAAAQAGIASEGAGRVAILASPLFHTAMQDFAAVLPEARGVPCKSFTDICDSVATGDTAYGILPLEDSVEGKLFRIYEQLEQLDLHIACTKDIPVQSESKTVRMALLYKAVRPSSTPCGTRTIECVLYEEGDAFLSNFLAAANAFGLLVRRIDSLPVSYREDGFAKHVMLKAADGVAPELLAAYITLFMPRTVIIADYINMDRQEGIIRTRPKALLSGAFGTWPACKVHTWRRAPSTKITQKSKA